MDPDVQTCFRSVYRQYGLKGFFQGWKANVIKDIPFAALKMSLYEAMATLCLSFTKQDTMRPNETILVGFVSGAATAVMTNPLDTINSRIKAGATSSTSILTAGREIYLSEGLVAFANGVLPRIFIFGFGSGFFWSVFHNVGMALDSRQGEKK